MTPRSLRNFCEAEPPNDPWWKGYTGGPVVQRIGAFVGGAFLILSGLTVLANSVEDHSRLGIVVSVLFFMAGVGAVIRSFTGRKANPPIP